jgi:sporulation protein YlmC with PRC-barrel domain
MVEHLPVRSAKELEGYRLEARDGQIGAVEDLYFDDDAWTVRYLVVDTGGWFSGRRVLVSPFAVEAIRWDAGQRAIEVDLTKDQVAGAPDVDTERPVSRRREKAYTDYYGWPRYWTGPSLWGAYSLPRMTSTTQTPEEIGVQRAAEEGDPHLRSAREVIRYDIAATDGAVGVVEDFLIEEGTWRIRHLVVDTSKWWFGRKVLLSPDWIDAVSWDDRHVVVRRSRDEIKSAPEWDPSASLARGDERGPHGHSRSIVL